MRALALAAAFLLFALPSWAQDITGPARVIDGDTLDIAGQRIRLHGIDAPESRQTCQIKGVPWACGVAAWGELVQLMAGKDVRCKARDVDRYGRAVAVCTTDGLDINAAMVAQGWALAYRQFSDDYVVQEGEAQKDGLGMWQGTAARILARKPIEGRPAGTGVFRSFPSYALSKSGTHCHDRQWQPVCP